MTYRRRKSFRTVSNKVRKVKTPGGKLVLHYTGKKGSNPTCGDPGCDQRLHGVRPPSALPLPPSPAATAAAVHDGRVGGPLALSLGLAASVAATREAVAAKDAGRSCSSLCGQGRAGGRPVQSDATRQQLP